MIALPFMAQAQTITQADLPTAGTAWTMNEDTNYVAAIPAGGTGQTWNYSTLLTNNIDTTAFQDAAGTPFASSFPSSNLATYQTTDGSYGYYTSNSSGLYLDGNGSATGNLIYNPSLLYIPVPFSYGSTATGMGRLVVDTSVAGQGYRIVLRFENTYEGDATGSLQTPQGTYNVLRVKMTQLVYDSISVELSPGTGIYVPFSGSVSQTTNYNFLSTGNTVNLIMDISADSLGATSTSSRYFSGQAVVSVEQIANAKKTVVYPNPAIDKINFKNDVNAEVIIYDNAGQEVKRVVGNVGNSVDIQSLKAGVYRYKVIYTDKTESGSFIVQH